ncbi:hypothetical protein JX266_006248 [Neoarthrinium moseri]|nr:hypothetical protein JX266_006248 [Neoarthrinium moseri]
MEKDDPVTGHICKTCDEVDTQCTICHNSDPRDNPKLCEHCQGWDDLTHITFCAGDVLPDVDPSVFEPPEFTQNTSPYPASGDLSQLSFRAFKTLEQARNCLICRIIVSGLRQCDSTREPTSVALWRLWPENWHSPEPSKRQHKDVDCSWTGKCLLTFCVVYPGDGEDSKPAMKPCLVELILSYSSWGHGLENVQFWDRRFLDPENIKFWLSHCQKHHGQMCDKTMFSTKLPSGFRVIDVVDECVMEPRGEIDDYVALSYEWRAATSDPRRDLMLSRKNWTALATSGALTQGRLPEVIYDAMQFCRDLGQRYLLVDRMCIFQDEDDEDGSRQVQIEGMDAIYWLATVTVVASADGVGVGLPGVSSRPRPFSVSNAGWGLSMDGPHCIGYQKPLVSDAINPSSWNTRGWTFQERWISRRHIFFGRCHTYLSCFYCIECETSLRRQDIIKAREANGEFGAFFARGVRIAKGSEEQARWDPLGQYLEAVNEYTGRSLGQASDVLNAFTGVNKFLITKLQTRSLFGLPAKYLFRSLLWTRRGPPPANLQGHIPTGVPSWSWAAGLGPVEYGWWTQNFYTKVGNLVRFWYSDGQTVSEVVEATSWFDMFKDNVRDDLSHEFLMERFRTNLDLNGGTYAPASAMWHHCSHSPWESLRHHEVSEIAIDIAKRAPGCLVFNTTTAYLGLRMSVTASLSTGGIIFDIVDQDGNAIGNVMPEFRPGDHKLSTIHHPSSRYHIIVLGACNRGKDSGQDWEPEVVHESQEAYRVRNACGLYVMVVDRNGHFSSRLGIGVVAPVGWTRVKPVWETIFLV